MYDINSRAATNRETQILNLRLKDQQRPYTLYYLAAAVFSCLFVIIGAYVFAIGAVMNIIISLAIFVFCIYKILAGKSIASSIKKNIARDLSSGSVNDITIAEAPSFGTLYLSGKPFWCFDIGSRKVLILSKDIINYHFIKYQIFNPSNDSDVGISLEGKYKRRREIKSDVFPFDKFVITIAPESGVVLSIRTGIGCAEGYSYAASFCGAECHGDCEIIDASPEELFKNPGEKFFLNAYESIKINKNIISFNELTGVFSGAFIFYCRGFDAVHGAALGWMASYTLSLFMVLAFDGRNKYDYFMSYLENELKPWQLGDVSKHSRKMQAAFIIINTFITFAFIVIFEPGLPYLAVLAASFAISIILLMLPIIKIGSSQAFIVELAALAGVYLIGFPQAAFKGFATICLIMLLIGLADKQHKIGMAVLNLFTGAGEVDENNMPVIQALRKISVINVVNLYLKCIFSVLTAFLIIAYFMPALPDILRSHSSKIFSKSATGERREKPGYTNEFGINFVFIPAGSFNMGSIYVNAGFDEKPAHKVTITNGFYLSATEITQKQWRAVMGRSAPCKFKGDDLPADSVSWNDCMDFVNKMNEVEKKKIYGLPTEAEWEYACRAKSSTQYCFGDETDVVDEYGWHFGNSNNAPHPVGLKKPNAWGLYDMHGNVWEWCLDNYAEYMPFELIDPRGPVLNASDDDKKLIRGGGWYNPQDGCTSTNRDAAAPSKRSSDMGMRLLKIDGGGSNKEIIK